MKRAEGTWQWEDHTDQLHNMLSIGVFVVSTIVVVAILVGLAVNLYDRRERGRK